VANAKTVIDDDTDATTLANDAEAEEEPTEEAEEEALSAPSRHHAVWCLTLNIGSCNGCDQQIQSLLAPRYQLARRGITFALSPRHADIILLTGVLTHRSLEPVRRVLAQVPDPHAIVAVGDCVIDGSVFAGSADVLPDAADLLGVNVEIAGNPPSPAQILRAIEEAARLLDAVDANSAATTEDEEESEDAATEMDDNAEGEEVAAEDDGAEEAVAEEEDVEEEE
jgi:membrane-bound hydrogenase subunit mbhJ